MAGGFVIDGTAIDVASGFGIGAGEIFISFIAKVNDRVGEFAGNAITVRFLHGFPVFVELGFFFGDDFTAD